MCIKDNQGEQSSRVVTSIVEEIQQSTNFSKQQIASLCRISTRTLYRMCSGKMRTPPMNSFRKLFEIYCLFCCVPHHKTLFYLVQSSNGKNKAGYWP